MNKNLLLLALVGLSVNVAVGMEGDEVVVDGSPVGSGAASSVRVVAAARSVDSGLVAELQSQLSASQGEVANLRKQLAAEKEEDGYTSGGDTRYDSMADCLAAKIGRITELEGQLRTASSKGAASAGGASEVRPVSPLFRSATVPYFGWETPAVVPGRRAISEAAKAGAVAATTAAVLLARRK